MQTQFNNSHHISQMAFEAFAELLNNAHEGALNGTIPLSLVRALLSLQQSFFSSTENQDMQNLQHQGSFRRAKPIKASRGQLHVSSVLSGRILIEKPGRMLAKALLELTNNIAHLKSSNPEEKQAVGRFTLSKELGAQKTSSYLSAKDASKAFPESKITDTTKQASNLMNSAKISTQKLLAELGRLFDVNKSPELKPYLATVLEMGNALTKAHDLQQMLSLHSSEPIVTQALLKGLANLGHAMKEFSALLEQVINNPALLPKLEAQMQTLNKTLQSLNSEIATALTKAGTKLQQGTSIEGTKAKLGADSSAIRQNPAIRELLTSLALKGTYSYGQASTVQQLATAKLPSHVIAPFSPEKRSEHRKFRSNLKKPGPEPIWEEDPQEDSSRENCEDEKRKDEENETLD